MALPLLPHHSLSPSASSSSVYGPSLASGALSVSAASALASGTSGTSNWSGSGLRMCSTAHVRFVAGQEHLEQRNTVMFHLGGGSLFSEMAVNAVYWDIGVAPNQNPIEELVRAFEGAQEDNIHTEPMALIGAGGWSLPGGFSAGRVPFSFGLPPGPLPRTQWCRAGGRLPTPLVMSPGRGFQLEIGFSRKWAPSRDVDLTFTLELA